ncbi:hypothetical protein [Pseudomonas oryzihabitans]|uniref:hypothetical protein n=1 Tax=Pseudomonas oryzihabitans TaxID=47885 RepID=UPI001D6A559B|nr:hypothetical protein [Pseudomonas oryzihabitans]HJE70239.1 hypothetical protein [Pseudomonas oryzihabitans]
MKYALEHRGGRTLLVDPAIYLKAIKARLACAQAQGARSIWIDHRDGLWHGKATHTALISALEQLAAEGYGLSWDEMRGIQMLRLDVDPKVSLAPAAVRSALNLVETWDTTPFKAPEPVAPPVSHGSQMGDYLLFLALIASLAGAPFGLARMLDAPTPGPWLLAFYYGVFGQTLYTWGSVLVKGFLAAERSRRHTPPA